MATSIIQANSEAKNNAVKGFIKGSSGAHKGTHQIIGEKITFVLGSNFSVEAVASAIEKGGVDDVESATGSATGGTSSQSDWTWSTDHGRYYRMKSDGTYEWSEVSEAASEAASDEEWTWSPQYCKILSPQGRRNERMVSGIEESYGGSGNLSRLGQK